MDTKQSPTNLRLSFGDRLSGSVSNHFNRNNSFLYILLQISLLFMFTLVLSIGRGQSNFNLILSLSFQPQRKGYYRAVSVGQHGFDYRLDSTASAVNVCKALLRSQALSLSLCLSFSRRAREAQERKAGNEVMHGSLLAVMTLVSLNQWGLGTWKK